MACEYLNTVVASGVEEGGAGRSPLSLYIVLEIRAHNNHYSVVKGYFRFKKLLRNNYFTRYKELKLCCLLDNIITF